MRGMKTTRTWQGVRMRRVTVGADPDAPMRLVTLPAAWDDMAAAALAGLAPGEGPVMLAAAADAWIRPVAERARRAGLEAPLAERLHRMLLLRHGAPSASVWQGQAAGVPGFVLNLASFQDGAGGFDAPAFAEAVETAVTALTLSAPAASTACDRRGRSRRPAGCSRHRIWLGCVAGDRSCARRHPARSGGGGVRRAGTAVRHRRSDVAGLA